MNTFNGSSGMIVLISGLALAFFPNWIASQEAAPNPLTQPPIMAAPTQSPQPQMTVDPVQDRVQTVLKFWFGSLDSPYAFPEGQAIQWYYPSNEFERRMRDEFESDVKLAHSGELNEWRYTPRGRLALILLLDQFSRYIYNGRPQAYASEAMARALVLEGLQLGDDKKLYPVERIFFYMPLQHSEDLKWQNLSVQLYRDLMLEASPELKSRMEAYFRYALHKRDIIERFQRFPQRNRILGRESTPEEIIYLNNRPPF